MLRIIQSPSWGFARGDHPDSEGRWQAVAPLLEAYPCRKVQRPSAAILHRSLEIHSQVMLHRAERASVRGGVLDPDTPTSPETWTAALCAQAAALVAVAEVRSQPGLRLFLPTRPPGHHATPTHSMGFCLLNHVALAAHQAAKHPELTPVLIVDFDVHHGNGTQEIFYSRNDVFFFSMHQYPLYPGSGTEAETGEGPGRLWTRNLPIPPGTPRGRQMERFAGALREVAEFARPRLVLVSAGFDAHRADPLAHLLLEAEDFAEMTRAICAVADGYAEGRVVSFLEGGYCRQALRDSVEAHLAALDAPPAPPASAPGS